jgi:hypothetical protein
LNVASEFCLILIWSKIDTQLMTSIPCLR